MTTRAEHMKWSKERALEYADQGDAGNAIASLRSDLGKHPDTEASAGIVDDLMVPLLLNGHLEGGELRKFIEGFS
jgi:hypothetical protein